MNSVRLWYKKSGLAIYTSHLDMNRCFTRAVRMAGIPLWYTEGFNPRPYLTFLLPLPLGQTGLREPIDIRTVEEISGKEIKERLNAVLPEGIEIVDVTEPLEKVHTIKDALYEINVSFADKESAGVFGNFANETVSGGVLNAEKRSKKGPKTVNLCDFITSFEAQANENNVKITAVLATGTEKNLNAGLLLDTLIASSGRECEKYDITRSEIYTENLKVFK